MQRAQTLQVPRLGDNPKLECENLWSDFFGLAGCALCASDACKSRGAWCAMPANDTAWLLLHTLAANDNTPCPLDYEDFDPATIPLFDDENPLDVATIMELLSR